MKRIIATLIVLGLMFMLFACGAGETTGGATTEASAIELENSNADEPAASVNSHINGAVMPPLQGGSMLYTFPSAKSYDVVQSDEGNYRVYHLGIVNDLGEVLSEPQYTYVKYSHGEDGSVNGLFAQKGKEFTWYDLDGTSKKLPFQAAKVQAIQNGRYWIVSRLGLTGDSFSLEEGVCDGLYDTQAEKFIFPPKDGLNLFSSGGLIFGNQYETSSFDSKRVRGFQWDPADNSTREFPMKWRCYGYFPETGWYEMVENYSTGGFELYIVDQNMEIVPELRTDWHIDERFDGGNHLVVRSRSDDSMNTWVNSGGTFSKLLYDQIQRYERCYIAWKDGSCWSGGTPTLFDDKLKIVHEAQNGETIVMLSDFQSNSEMIVLMDKESRIQKAWDPRTCKEINLKSKSGCWFNNESAYILENGRWRTIDPAQYCDKAKGEDGAWFCQVTEDGFIIRLAVLKEGVYATEERYIAVDWNGKPTNHPLLRFYKNGNKMSDAGEQGPNYFWAEQDGARGYVNEKGEWLFKHE